MEGSVSDSFLLATQDGTPLAVEGSVYVPTTHHSTSMLADSLVNFVLATQDGTPLAVEGSVYVPTTYSVSPSQTFPPLMVDDFGNVVLDDAGDPIFSGSDIIYAGIRDDLVATQLAVQIDVHGPASGDTLRVLDALFRSDLGVDAFHANNAAVTPLFLGDAVQAPFINAEQQYEYRWTVEANLQINPVVSTPQQFFDRVEVADVPVDAFMVP
jgi:hypothetical protein